MNEYRFDVDKMKCLKYHPREIFKEKLFDKYKKLIVEIPAKLHIL